MDRFPPYGQMKLNPVSVIKQHAAGERVDLLDEMKLKFFCAGLNYGVVFRLLRPSFQKQKKNDLHQCVVKRQIRSSLLSFSEGILC